MSGLVAASDEQLDEIAASQHQLSTADETRLAVSGPNLNAAWHQAIYRTAGSRYLEEFISRLWTALPVEALWVTGHARANQFCNMTPSWWQYGLETVYLPAS
jgi:DNA-binding GntR family transcriptional regulator